MIASALKVLLPADSQGAPADARTLRFKQSATEWAEALPIGNGRHGTQPLNLQGIRNNDLDPRWESKYTININTEMNYLVAEVCNLSECHEPLLRMVGEPQAPGRDTAKVH